MLPALLSNFAILVSVIGLVFSTWMALQIFWLECGKSLFFAMLKKIRPVITMTEDADTFFVDTFPQQLSMIPRTAISKDCEIGRWIEDNVSGFVLLNRDGPNIELWFSNVREAALFKLRWC